MASGSAFEDDDDEDDDDEEGADAAGPSSEEHISQTETEDSLIKVQKPHTFPYVIASTKNIRHILHMSITV